MAITMYSGPPGAGKSYALLEQVIVPGVMAGRRVLTNIDGVDPDKVWRYCVERSDDPGAVGSVVLFDGRQAKERGFFPTEQIPDTETFVKGGDLLVFDEWKLYFPRRGKLPCTPAPTVENPAPISDVEGFLRWHRHLSDAKGVTCDVAIASQLPTDVHQDFRGLIERSYKFKKLKAVGLNNSYAWDAYEGHLQPKGGAYKTGNGRYKPEIFALYSSYSTTKNATELQTDGRSSVITKWTYASVGLGLVTVAVSAWWVWGFFTGGADGIAPAPPAAVSAPGSAARPASSPARADSGYRIVGHILGDAGTRVIVLDDSGALRVMRPDTFSFDGERPISGYIDGKRVIAEDRIEINRPAPIPALGFGS